MPDDLPTCCHLYTHYVLGRALEFHGQCDFSLCPSCCSTAPIACIVVVRCVQSLDLNWPCLVEDLRGVEFLSIEMLFAVSTVFLESGFHWRMHLTYLLTCMNGDYIKWLLLLVCNP